MKLITISIMVSSLLFACGSEESQPEVNIEQTEPPDFKGWNKIDGELSCLPMTKAFESDCQAIWKQGTENCGQATVIFVRTESDYVYVQKLEKEIIRQGQMHNLVFRSAPEVFNVKDKPRDDRLDAYYYCEGPNQ